MAQCGVREAAYFSENFHAPATGKGPSLGHPLRPGLLLVLVGAQPQAIARAKPEEHMGFRATSAWDSLDAETLLDSEKLDIKALSTVSCPVGTFSLPG